VSLPSAGAGSYFDAASGLPMSRVTQQALLDAGVDGWADPTKLYAAGRQSAVLLDAARAAMAELLDVHPDEVSFVPSAAHALHLAVLGTLAGRRRAGTRLVHSAVEHSTVFAAAQYHRNAVLAGLGPRADPERADPVQVIAVDGYGRVDRAEFIAAATAAGTAAAVLQAANHEVGTRQPVGVVARALAEARVPLVVDATHELVYGSAPAGAPVFTADPRLWGGPAGVGVLVVRRGTRWAAPFPTDGSEGGRSSGAVNVPAALAAAASLRAFRSDSGAQADRLDGLVRILRQRLTASVPDSVALGDPDDRLPHLLTISSLYVDGQSVLTALDRSGFSVSSGSSCTADTLTPSHVLVAMGALTSGNIRISLHPGVTEAEVHRFAAVLPTIIEAVRAELPTVSAAPPGPPDPTGPTAGDPEPADRSGQPRTVDSRGRRCPLPVLDLARAWPELALGDQLVVLADDPAAATDIAAWSRMRGQQLLDVAEHPGGGTAYRLERRT
jgi:cysteine desulfurase